MVLPGHEGAGYEEYEREINACGGAVWVAAWRNCEVVDMACPRSFPQINGAYHYLVNAEEGEEYSLLQI